MGVVACFSPLFYNERWQLIIPTLEIYRQMGVGLQIYYVQSMITEILEFMKIYEAKKVAKIETWDRLSFSDSKDLQYPLGYDPNTELEWRNQAAAHSDCLLNYKEVAEFIIISDIDDVLFPKLGNTFLEEFHILRDKYPNAAGFSYNRYNTELITTNDPAYFSLSNLINSARISDEWEDPKYVVRPERVETAWLHWPGIIHKGEMMTLPNELNFMVHFRNWSMHFKLFDFQIKDVIKAKKAEEIEKKFREFMLSIPNGNALFEELPKNIRYYPIIAECYNRIFYARAKVAENCPGPLRCNIAAIPGLKCSLAKREFIHQKINIKHELHFSTKPPEFIVSNNGCSV